MGEQFRGCIDICSQTEIAGWTTAPWLEVYANGENLCRITSGGPRSDLIEAGINAGRSFHDILPRSLWLDDRVSVRLPDDSRLVPSDLISHTVRLKQLLSGIDLGKPGLEIGPLNRAIIPRSCAQVYYVDNQNQEGLKHRYAEALKGEVNKIPTIDFIWTEGRSLSQIVAYRKFNWVIASHVGEHIADFIGWLEQLADVLDVGGCVSLALPHAERTFDACRPVSTFHDLVAAHIMKLSRPSAHQVLGYVVGVLEN